MRSARQVFVSAALLMLVASGCASITRMESNPILYDSRSMEVIGPVSAELSTTTVFGLPTSRVSLKDVYNLALYGRTKVTSVTNNVEATGGWTDAYAAAHSQTITVVTDEIIAPEKSKRVILNPQVEETDSIFWILPFLGTRTLAISGTAAELKGYPGDEARH